jgi:hypothetical protein
MGGMCEIPIPVEFNCEVVVVDGSRADELDVEVGVIFADFAASRRSSRASSSFGPRR